MSGSAASTGETSSTESSAISGERHPLRTHPSTACQHTSRQRAGGISCREDSRLHVPKAEMAEIDALRDQRHQRTRVGQRHLSRRASCPQSPSIHRAKQDKAHQRSRRRQTPWRVAPPCRQKIPAVPARDDSRSHHTHTSEGSTATVAELQSSHRQDHTGLRLPRRKLPNDPLPKEVRNDDVRLAAVTIAEQPTHSRRCGHPPRRIARRSAF